ncbi:MAG: citrate lyase subunit beta / citryl-CoA lyase [Actinomycetota bacterium]|jgi:citrate lyase subunit beta/citryl-CoA lyase|nr:citrate lyase subunit beta / citryl-CoA lyase [Actinomycetota bacterium]
MLSKAPGLPADQIFMDLEDSVAPLAKADARGNVIDALKNNDWGDKTVVVRINSIDTQWAADDLKTVVEAAGDLLDCIMIPKVQHAHEVLFVDHMLRMIETNTGMEKRIGLEVQIETATGLKNIHEIAHASDRMETLIFGPADMSASLGLPTVTAGLPMPGYPGDHFHWVLETILVAARDAGLQAIDGPYLLIKDLDGFREMALRSRALGYDGKWALHPGQVDVLNEVFTPTQEEYDKAEALLDAYKHATEVDRTGAVMFGKEMIDEASRKMAIQFAERGRAAGMTREKKLEDFQKEWAE